MIFFDRLSNLSILKIHPPCDAIKTLVLEASELHASRKSFWNWTFLYHLYLCTNIVVHCQVLTCRNCSTLASMSRPVSLPSGSYWRRKILNSLYNNLEHVIFLSYHSKSLAGSQFGFNQFLERLPFKHPELSLNQSHIFDDIAWRVVVLNLIVQQDFGSVISSAEGWSVDSVVSLLFQPNACQLGL